MQLYGNWKAAARERTAHPEGSVAPPRPVEQRTLMGRFHVVPLVSWSQFIIFSHVLDKGKAIAPSVEHGVPRRSMFGRRGETLLCIVLLLCGDVQLNPGPVVLPMASQHQPQVIGSGKQQINKQQGGIEMKNVIIIKHQP
uniref:Uncharacterized protein n=1 Tax=Knipowitschia caucasica TaxID=637954 RepID=A0AAV2IUF6_KNICA